MTLPLVINSVDKPNIRFLLPTPAVSIYLVELHSICLNVAVQLLFLLAKLNRPKP